MKKIVFLVLILLQISLVVACNNNNEPVLIGDEFIYKVKEDSYYIYFYKDGCSSCEKVHSSIIDYNKKALRSKELKNVYKVNLHPEGGQESSIYRKFSFGETGQGSQQDFYVNGVDSWGLLYIAATPSLIEINTIEVEINGVKETKKVAKFLCEGVTNIQECLENLVK